MTDQDVVDVAQLTVVCANHGQARQYIEATHAHEAWGDGMSIDEFQAIVDQEMAEAPWAQEHGDMTWVLVRRSDPLGRILAGCETHRTKALIKRSGNVEETHAYGITNVTTPAALRRKGYARHLLRCLHYILAGPKLPPFPEQWGEPPSIDATIRRHVPYASFSYLSSDVGQTYYATCTIGLDSPGYVINLEDQTQLTWRILPAEQADGSDGWCILSDEDFPRIKPILSAGAKSKLALHPSQSAFAVDPLSPGTLEMVPQRGQMSSRKPWLTQPHREPRGVQRGDAIVMFARDNYQIATDTLLITYTHNLSPEDLPSLLSALDGLANQVGLTRGWVWGLDTDCALVKAWEGREGRDAKASLRQGVDEHLYGVARYEGEGQLIDQQMWIWL